MIKHFYKKLFFASLILSINPDISANIQPIAQNKAQAKQAPIFLKQGYDLSLGVLLGFLTGGTCAVVDFASGGKSMPFTWATTFFMRWKFTQSLGGTDKESQSRCATASMLVSWAAYGLALLLLVTKKSPRV